MSSRGPRRSLPIVELLRMACCGSSWVGVERAHCCRRTGGCGYVFDTAQLWDAHRPQAGCIDPRSLDLVQTKNGIWLERNAS
jgi:hypothetical protein